MVTLLDIRLTIIMKSSRTPQIKELTQYGDIQFHYHIRIITQFTNTASKSNFFHVSPTHIYITILLSSTSYISLHLLTYIVHRSYIKE